MKKVPTGIDDFKTIIERNYLYIDKTLLIKDIIDDFDKPLCIIRPRRFCKSVNMSMLDYYFNLEYKDNNLFKGLKIMKCGDTYLSEMNRYPVILISFKELKKNNYSSFIDRYKTLMADLYLKYKFVLENPDVDKEFYNRIIKKQEESELTNALSYLVKYLRKYYNKQVIVLLDEYDVPIIGGYLNGYYKEVLDFVKEIFASTFKNNINLKKGVVTGVFRVAIEELETGANNFNVYNITDNEYSNYYGFTEEEIKEVLKEYGLSDKLNEVKKWYDGYLFGNTTIYNPISILNYLIKQRFETYWVNTGGVDLLKNLIFDLRDNSMILDEFHRLLENGVIERVSLDLHMNLTSLKGDRNTIWTLFMLTGYLTPLGEITNLENVTLKIPNLEVKKSLENIASSWFKKTILTKYNFIEYLINNRMDMFISNFEKYILETFSYYDVPSNDDGERFYHAYVLGLLTSGNEYFEIKSNRESGYGRYDLMLKPVNNDIEYAYIIEVKLANNDNFAEVIEKGFKQIDENKYENEIQEYNVIKMVIAFNGKKVKIETR